ncbi:MAG TPA: hypothetical protein EYO45_04560 [Candidatus Marinimicrobia bacterium]|nr:hypothetical protein [Candidatus Neomarinimicrobiota bacterium]
MAVNVQSIIPLIIIKCIALMGMAKGNQIKTFSNVIGKKPNSIIRPLPNITSRNIMKVNIMYVVGELTAKERVINRFPRIKIKIMK